ncbi:MAG: extracellular solute-binding protein [Candidatus Paceibacterota bacterium]|jgi:ABC-type glycerol-3-phosphate transport system substrate-binding protein
MSKFQIIILSFFIICIVAGVAVFATYKGGNSAQNKLDPITIWGTFPQDAFDSYVAKVNLTLSAQLSITYVQKNRNTFSQEFVAALARGQGPDSIIIPADMLLPHIDKLTPVPYSALSQRDFMETFIEEGEIYLSQNGTYALPFAVDPLVMYWNRDIFSAAGLPSYPVYWEDFVTVNQKITTRDSGGAIRRSAVALGDFSNIVNAREILGSMILQSGNIVTRGTGNDYESSLRQEPVPLRTLEFFTQSVDPNSKSYSWNRSMPDSKTAFLSGTLATYFGFASELADIRAKNPNLNFDVAPLPQWKSGYKSVYSKMYGYSILRTSQYQNSAYQTFAILGSAANMSELSTSLYLPSVRRDIIASGSTDPYVSVFNEQALIGKTWYDADSSISFTILGNMVDSVTSGAKSLRDALSDASDQYDVALKQAVQ